MSLPSQPPQFAQPTMAKTNGFAIASFALAFFGFWIIPIILSVVFGLRALGQVKAKGQRGRGLAIAGLVISGLYVCLFAGVAWVSLASPT